MDTNNLYWDSVMSENISTPSARDSSYVSQSNVVSDTAYRDPETRELLFGTMPVNTDLQIMLGIGESYRIPVGYHSGNSIIFVQDLREMTLGTATEDDIGFNKVAWVNGKRVVGKLNISKNKMTATATEDDLLMNKTAWVDGKLVTGKIPVILRTDYSLKAGESYVIEKGYHGGEAIVSAADLKSQTAGNATEYDIAYNKIAWVNGEIVIGKAKTIIDSDANYSAKETDLRSGKTAFSSAGYIEGSMNEYLNQPTKKLLCSQSFTIPEGYHDGLWVIQTDSLANQTKATATEDDIREGTNAWVDGILVEGRMHQTNIEETYGDATEYDIQKDKIAWVNGEKVVGKCLYDSVSFNARINNKDNSESPISVSIPEPYWNTINAIDVYIISNEDNSYLYDFHYIDYSADNIIEENDNDIPILSIVSSYGSSDIIFTSFVNNSYIELFVNNYKY